MSNFIDPWKETKQNFIHKIDKLISHGINKIYIYGQPTYIK